MEGSFAMAMYAQLLEEAIDEDVVERTLGDLLGELRERRQTVVDTEASTGLDAVAGQLAYDLTLVEVCRRVGIAYRIEAFGNPGHERARLEAILAGRGILAR